MHACKLQEMTMEINSSYNFLSLRRAARFTHATPVTRGVTRLDGARGKKQVWRPHVRTWGFFEANVLYWRKYFDIVGTFQQHPPVIRRPTVLSAREIVPPSLRPWLHVTLAQNQTLSRFFKVLVWEELNRITTKLWLAGSHQLW